MKSAGSRVAGTPRKEGGVQVKVTLRKPTLAVKSITSPGTSVGSKDCTLLHEQVMSALLYNQLQAIGRTTAHQLTIEKENGTICTIWRKMSKDYTKYYVLMSALLYNHTVNCMQAIAGTFPQCTAQIWTGYVCTAIQLTASYR